VSACRRITWCSANGCAYSITRRGRRCREACRVFGIHRSTCNARNSRHKTRAGSSPYRRIAEPKACFLDRAWRWG
jgi:hypothetical protein